MPSDQAASSSFLALQSFEGDDAPANANAPAPEPIPAERVVPEPPAEPTSYVVRVPALPPSPWLEVPEGVAVIGPIATERKARDHALVLQSMGIAFTRRFAGVGWVLWVEETDYRRATKAIERYERENRDWPPPQTVRERLRFDLSPIAPLMFVALVVFFSVTGPVSGGSLWFQKGSSVAQLVVTSEPWRALTALTLHADSTHVLGNALSGTLFSAAVMRRFGAGGGSLAILASGVIGNLANAGFYAAQGIHHGSIGASTAVFGAVGILAATQLVLDKRESGREAGWLTWARPLAGGLALLATLGASPQSDLGAHLFGFLGGLGVGAALAFPARLAEREDRAIVFAKPLVQAALGAVTLGLTIGAWELAILGGR
jgi:rhomboid protease GluP